MVKSNRSYRVLGLDLGNAKLKALYLDVRNEVAQRCCWDSMPIPVTQNRAMDFQLYLPLQLLAFFNAHGIEKSEIQQVVVCCSHSFGFDPYSESVRHLQQVLSAYFAEVPVALVSADGQLTPLADLSALSESALYAYVFTNFYGSAWLGSQCIDQGLSLDMGTTTLDIIPIHQGEIDPTGLQQNPQGGGGAADYLRFRYHQNRIHWLGMTVTPLEKLCQRVSLADKSYQVVPRNYRTDNLFALLNGGGSHRQGDDEREISPQLLKRHAYGQVFPEPKAAHRALAESIGLDRYLLSQDEAEAVQQVFLEALIQHTAEAIEQVLWAEFGPRERWKDLHIASFALGAEAVVMPALTRLGFQKEQCITLNYKKAEGLWSASSVFAMALLALKHIGGDLHWR